MFGRYLWCLLDPMSTRHIAAVMALTGLLTPARACGTDDTTGGTGTAIGGASMDVDSCDDARAALQRRALSPGSPCAAAMDEARAMEAVSGGGAAPGRGGSGGGSSAHGATQSNTGLVDPAGGGGSTRSPLDEVLVRCCRLSDASLLVRRSSTRSPLDEALVGC